MSDKSSLGKGAVCLVGMRLVYLYSGPSAGLYSWIHGYSPKLVRAQGLSILEFSLSLRIFFTSSISSRRPYSYSLHPLHWGRPGCVPGSLLDTFRGMREWIGPFYAHRAKEGWDFYLGSLSTQSLKATTSAPLLGNPLLDSCFLQEDCSMWHNPSKSGFLFLYLPPQFI